MMAHVPREKANATCNGRLLPPWSTISATCDMDHLTKKTNYNIQHPTLNTIGMIFAIAATITGRNANNINGKATRMIGQHG
jgi:hypothetical protein